MNIRISLGRMLALSVMVLLMTGNAFAASGKDVFKSNKCGGCHNVSGSAAASFQAQAKRKGPDLWYAGSKYQQAWLESYLQKPKIIRPMAFGSINKKNKLKHPALSAADAKGITTYLVSLKSDKVTQGVIKKANKGIRGKILFKKKQACYGCHRIPGKRGKESGGFSGPSLVGASKRLKGDFIHSYLKNPQAFMPAGMMPHYGHLKKNELKTLAAYVISFK